MLEPRAQPFRERTERERGFLKKRLFGPQLRHFGHECGAIKHEYGAINGPDYMIGAAVAANIGSSIPRELPAVARMGHRTIAAAVKTVRASVPPVRQ